jgi:hypothetical protein
MTTEDNKDQDFSFFEKLVIVLLWFSAWMYNTDLRENGYEKKYRSRKYCIIIGILLYALIILFANVKLI